jgi:deaminated glutathione amidase
MMAQTFRAAAVQMVSGPDVQANLDAASALIGEAAAQGARLIALPEYFCIMGMRDSDKVAVREEPGNGPVQKFLSSQAARHGVWIVGGTAPLACRDAGRVRNACLVFDERGRQVARYDKMHLFGFTSDAERYDEAATIEHGDTPVCVESPFGKLGLSVCYDIRFPELYRSYCPADVLFVPSAFTVPTGEAHWETLLRARAIENLAFVIAPAQGGTHPSGRRTWGHSMIIDPWGRVLAALDHGPGVVVADIDTAVLYKVRADLPALEHRMQANGVLSN